MELAGSIRRKTKKKGKMKGEKTKKIHETEKEPSGEIK